jgi:aminoglycoside phosphotransferase
MVDDTLRVTGVIDFGPLTVMGDAAMDLAGAAIFLEVARGFEPDDVTYVVDRLQQRHGDAILHAVEMYRLWYAVRFSPYKADDGKLFAWCVASLAAARV